MCPVFIAQTVTEGNKAVFNQIGRSALHIGEFEVIVLFMAIALVNNLKSTSITGVLVKIGAICPDGVTPIFFKTM